jgi:hypothetical protein
MVSTIYEIGLVHNGLPIIRRQYCEQEELNSNPMLVGGFLSAIQQFSSATFEDLPTLIKMERFLTYFHVIDSPYENLFLYAISKVGIEPNKLKQSLINIKSKIRNLLPYITEENPDTEKFEWIFPIFDEECEYLNSTTPDSFVEWMENI